MVDPLSISFGATGTAAVVLHSLHRLSSFIRNIEGAPKVIRDLSTDLDTLQNVLQNLKSVVNSSNVAYFGVQERILPLLDPPLRNCIKVLNSFDEKIKPFVKPSTRPKKSKWRNFLWAYRKKDFIDLKTVLASHKASLEIALGAANLANNIAGFSELQNQVRDLQQRIEIDDASIAGSSTNSSSTLQTEYNFALKRFLVETETIFDDVLENASLGSTGIPQQKSPVFGMPETLYESPGHQVIDQENLTLKRRKSKPERTLLPANSVITDTHRKLYCTMSGCVLPYISVALEGMDDLFFNEWNSKSPPEWRVEQQPQVSDVSANTSQRFNNSQQLAGRTSSKPHLYGFNAYGLAIISPDLSTHHAEVIQNLNPHEEPGLVLRRGDIVQFAGTTEYKDWHMGLLGRNRGTYPTKYVRPCSFRTYVSWRLLKALQGRPLLDETRSRYMFFALRDVTGDGPHVQMRNLLERMPKEVEQIFEVVIANLQYMKSHPRLDISWEDQVELWSDALLSDVDWTSLKFPNCGAIFDEWKRKVVQFIMDTSTVLEDY